MMLNRSNDVELDFDFDKFKKKTKTILYFMFNMLMQEINSILRTLNLNLLKNINLKKPIINLMNGKRKF